ncbi:MAG: class I SAM-dependent methyltransferase [Desulfobacterales bacterium]
MGYVFTYQDAIAYERFLCDPSQRVATDLQNRLMMDMLEPIPEHHVLGVGCGIGTGLSVFPEKRVQITGLDASPYMIDIAKKNLGNQVDLHCGPVENLPFDDNSFHYACMMMSLEYANDPQKAIAEACRVTKDRLFLGVMNQHSIKGISLKAKGMVADTIYTHARFFSVWELIRIIRTLSGDVPISWRTIGLTSKGFGRISRRIRRSGIVRWYPFGTFIGIVVTLKPRFRTRPLAMAYSAKP